MKVAFDPQIFVLQRHGGVSRYFVELHKSLVQNELINSQIIAPIHFNAYLRDLPGHNGIYIPKSTDFLNFNELIRSINFKLSERIFNTQQPDVLHETFYGDRASWQGSYRTITTIHDLTRERLNVDSRKIERKARAVARADGIISVSKNTTTDLFEFYEVPESKVRTIYVGVSDFFRVRNEETKALVQQEVPFLLFVGHRGGYKNWRALIKAISSSSFLKNNFKLFCFGGNPFSAEEKNLLHELELVNQVHFLQGDDKLLRSIYQNAVCMVYPSLYEGFGSPVIEAMASGCPVFTSNSSALVESGGHAAEYFSPESVDSIIATLEKGLSSENSLNAMAEKGLVHSQNFTWEKTARETLDFYMEFES